jgi:formylglycine-generating enzyme required for sulfatase activity
MAEFTLQRQRRSAQYFKENLGSNLDLEMVLVPGGSFLMGSSSEEPERYDSESPQHLVTVPPCFMGRYPVTQAQWQAVANFPQVNRTLDPNPSYFKGKTLPVEQVSWSEAVEFCDRLSRFVESRLSHQTTRTYRLPTEAEWEYACRAGTTTPFHFGETITADLANYNSSVVYGRGIASPSKGQTTPVDQFGSANAFGLCDMHGNVWEWCLDHWHKNYKGAPTDGSAWLSNSKNANYVVRGGSWLYLPRNCRSACRIDVSDDRYSLIGFRVVCVPPRTL